ncbi:inverse autotransporter beta-barrel domain-containing protein [Verrucomicrobium sp. BvORR106]|uniref:inverse autotransporter beta domain-containing protein n=1 Tax=Verrucomicrobium sp. BvORR106 TaxID=1403819 RepID=UPI00056DDCA0|nr:inverse autotransporter beta-barrel domain-containing protein [Verrucomicrobium sp. BvORR106]
MKTRTYVWGTLCVLMATSHVAPLTAGPAGASAGKESKAVTLEDRWSLPGTFGGGIKTTGEYTDGNLFLVVPLHSSLGREGILGGDVLFLEPYTSWGERGEVAASLGLGWRHLFSDQSVTAITRHDGHQAGFMEEGFYVGANVFVDMLDTEADNQFWQLGFGVEAGTRYLEVRGNYYLPLSDRQLAEEIRTRETFTNSRTRTYQSTTPLNQPFATGNSIQQDALFTTRRATTTSTTTIERLFQRFEDGMEGWDAEVAVLVPGLDKYCDLKLVGGYFKFDNQPFGPQTGGTGNVEGWKAGVELRPVPALVLTATWYEDERFVGDDWLFGLRMELPFEMGDLGDGKTFWKRISDSFRPRRRHLAERLAEPVHRQNAAIKVASVVEEAAAKASTQVKTVTKVVAQSARRLVLKEDIVFANNGPATGNGIQEGDKYGDGTAERPLNTIQAAANIAQDNSNTTLRTWNVYTQASPYGYHEDVKSKTGNVLFISSSELIDGVGGTTFGTGQKPDLYGGFNASNIEVFGVIGYSIHGGLAYCGDPDGIRMRNVMASIIGGNDFYSVNGDAINVRMDDGNTGVGVAFGNNFYNTGGNAINIKTRDDDTAFGFIVLANAFYDGHDNDVEVKALDRSFIEILAHENWFTGGSGHAFRIRGYDHSEIKFDATSNHILDAGMDGFHFSTKDCATLTAILDGNFISNVGDDGVDAEAKGRSSLILTLLGNRFSGAGEHYIQAESYKHASLSLTANSNFFNSAVSDAIHMEAYGCSIATLIADGNVIRDQLGYGIYAWAGSDAQLTSTITNNVIQSPIVPAIHLVGGGYQRFTIENNLIEDAPTGINLDGYDNADMQGTVRGNIIRGSYSEGVVVNSSDSALMDVQFDQNSISGSYINGIRLNQVGGTLNVFSTFSNSVTGFSSEALSVSGSPTGSIIINGVNLSPPSSFP